MTEETPYSPPSMESDSTPQRKLRWWFLVGFLLVFVGMMFMHQSFYNGRALVRCTTWRFYLLEIDRLFTSSGNLGPTSGSSTIAFMILLTHLIVSAVAGLCTMGLGAIVRRFRP